ncbi:MAG: exodeoxyribonuclease VII large subunit [Actinobacteria bacterium]|nr:exodeoxyribonuclease VII large subunit [Actinomycetota bacterium]
MSVQNFETSPVSTDGYEPLSVTQAMNLVKRTLEGISVTVVGEVSELSDKRGYKAVYFTLSDDAAKMSCLIWRNVYEACDVELRTGMLVEVRGTFSAYPARGSMNFSVREIRVAGEGDLRLRVALLAKKLEKEGLMDPSRKRPIPELPQKIAIVTSPRGKAIHDCLRTLRRRYPLGEVLICGVAVEGVGAAAEICKGLRVAEDARPDVIMLVRGGGSYEDLMPFNDEQLARQIAACSVPVVTGIGHEPDNSIADMVADVRCSTPTAAAEAIAPSSDELLSRVNNDGMRLANALSSSMVRSSHRLTRIEDRPIFRDLNVLLGMRFLALDTASDRLTLAIPDALAKDSQKLGYLGERLARVKTTVFAPFERSLGLAASRLQDLSPLAILQRGFAVAMQEDEKTIIKSVETLNAGDDIHVLVADGSIFCTVTGTRKDLTRALEE